MKFSFNEGVCHAAKVHFEKDPSTGSFSQRICYYPKKETQVSVMFRTRNCDVKKSSASVLLHFKFNKNLPLLQMQQLLNEQVGEVFDYLESNINKF